MNIKNEKKKAIIRINDYGNEPYFVRSTDIIKPAFPIYKRPLIDYAIDVALNFGNIKEIYFICYTPLSTDYIDYRQKINQTNVEYKYIRSNYGHPFDNISGFMGEHFKNSSLVYIDSESLLFGDLEELTEVNNDVELYDGVYYSCGKQPIGFFYIKQSSMDKLHMALTNKTINGSFLQLMLQGTQQISEVSLRCFKKEISSSVFRFDVRTIQDVVEASQILMTYTRSGRDVANIGMTALNEELRILQ
jgi:hypothetical protein